jgi:hypothetical protein
MRESGRTEKMRLPRDATEVWLETQTPGPNKAEKHRNPPNGVYEAWLEKLVERKRARAATI